MFFAELLRDEVLSGTGVYEREKFLVLSGCLVMYYHSKGIDMGYENVLREKSRSSCLFSSFDKFFGYFRESFLQESGKEFHYSVQVVLWFFNCFYAGHSQFSRLFFSLLGGLLFEPLNRSFRLLRNSLGDSRYRLLGVWSFVWCA